MKLQRMTSRRTISSIRSIAAVWLSAATRAASLPCRRSISVNQASGAFTRWAVVRQVSPPATGPSSRTTTRCFSSDRR